MKHSVNILNELEEISPKVAQVGCNIPYTVPAGYFSGLSDQILQRIRSGEEVLPPVVRAAAGLAYTVPAGYFDQLAETVMKRVKADDDSLSADEELSILSPLLSGIGKQLPFQTPAGYFAGLEESVLSGTQALDAVNEELENLPPVLAGLHHTQTYSVPAGYFEQLPAVVLGKVQAAAKPTKVVSFGTRRFMQYAAAAVVAGLIAVGAWYFTGTSGTPAGEAVASKVEKLSEDELRNYLETQSAPMPASDLLAVHKPELETSDLSGLLENVSDEEIQRYLEQNLLTQQTATN